LRGGDVEAIEVVEGEVAMDEPAIMTFMKI
jgi:hypothetical protein